jgi:histidinol-phosphate/aromatic aminotransferase/cobyric acid decarboxylase-like protein
MRHVPPTEHTVGGPPASDRKAPSGVLDFSGSLCPLGPPAAVARKLGAVRSGSESPPSSRAFQELLARRLGVPAPCLLSGNGSAELLSATARAFMAPGDRIHSIGPTLLDPAALAHQLGAQSLRFTARKKDRFVPDLPALERVLRRDEPRLVILSNPNDLTGIYLRRKELLVAAGFFDGLLVIDETYLPFAGDQDSLLDSATSGRILLLRSLVEGYALPGPPLAYAVGAPAAIEALRAAQQSDSVDPLALAAGCAALGDDSYLGHAKAAVTGIRDFLESQLQGLGFDVVASSSSFVLAGGPDAAKVSHELLARGLAVLDCTPFQLPEYIRIGLRPHEDCSRLLDVLRGLAPELHG